MTVVLEFNGTTFDAITSEDGNPTAQAAQALRLIHGTMIDAGKAFNRAKRLLMAGTLDAGGFSDNAGVYAAIVGQVRDAIRVLPLKTTAKGGATPQTVWCEFFEGVDARLERNMTRADAKAANKRTFV